MTQTLVRRIRQGETKLYRELRLAALADAPDAFGTTLEESLARPAAFWRQRLAVSPNELPLFGFVDGVASGLGWASVDPEDGSGWITHMWTAPHCRRQGLAARIIEAGVRFVATRGAEQVLLEVNVANPDAVRVYEAAGFVAFGETELLRPGSEEVVQPMRLVVG